MFGSAVLEVAIGLVFIYLLVSLMVTAVNKIIANTKSRAKYLWRGIEAMLKTAAQDGQGQTSWTTKFYEHPLVFSAQCPRPGSPSYIPSRSFAIGLLVATGVTNASVNEWQRKRLANIDVIFRLDGNQ